jgi:hypothetical protein
MDSGWFVYWGATLNPQTYGDAGCGRDDPGFERGWPSMTEQRARAGIPTIRSFPAHVGGRVRMGRVTVEPILVR